MSLRQLRRIQDQNKKIKNPEANGNENEEEEEDEEDENEIIETRRVKPFNPFEMLSNEEIGPQKKSKKKKKAKPKVDKGKGKAIEEEGEREQPDEHNGDYVQNGEQFVDESVVDVAKENFEEGKEEEEQNAEPGNENAEIDENAEQNDEEPDEDQEGEHEGEGEGEENVNPSSSSSSKKKNKRNKKKGKGKGKAKAKSDEGVEEIIKELDQKFPSVNKVASKAKEPVQLDENETYRRLFTVETKYFDSVAEMKKLFGSKIVESEMRRKVHNKKSVKKTILVTPQDNWPLAEKVGFSMELLNTEGGISQFKFVHPRHYQEVQFHFLDCVDSFDPNNIAQLINMYPFHVDSLLTLSEVCKHSSDLTNAAEFVEKALFCFEKSFHPMFSLTNGKCRLPFERAENRPFYLAIFRHTQYLGRKGCWRTALEFTKLLINVDPIQDPYCAFLMIDFFALRSNEYKLVIEVFEKLQPFCKLSLLPNWAFSYALAHFHLEKEDHSKSRKLLIDAILRFPSTISQLMDVCKVNLPVSISPFQPVLAPNKSEHELELLITLFIERSNSLWKEPEVLDWWKSCATAAHKIIHSNSTSSVELEAEYDPTVLKEYDELRKREYARSPLSIFRHVLVSDFKKVNSWLPSEISNGAIMMHDPLPPLNSISDYSRPHRPSRQSNDERNPYENDSVLTAFLRSLLPWTTEGGQPGDALGEIQRNMQQLINVLQQPPPQDDNNQNANN